MTKTRYWTKATLGFAAAFLVAAASASAAELLLGFPIQRRGGFSGGVSKSMLKQSRLNFDKIEKCE
ncbi:MAG: hypothetical protein ACOX2U_03525 [Limisphaerales bacterium]